MEQFYKRVFAIPREYKNIKFRSTMEKDFAMFLDGKLVKYKGNYYFHKPILWEYETKEFELLPQENWIDKTEQDKSVKKIIRNKKHVLPKIIYTPDFYLPEYNLLIECKGYQFDDELFSLRFRLFKHKYPTLAIWKVKSHTQFIDIDDVLKSLEIDRKNEN